MIHGIIGLMNSGKTLYMTYLLFEQWLHKKQLITNYDIFLKGSKKINQDFLIELGIRQPVIDNIALGFDELWIWLDARAHAKKENLVATYFFNQSSKDDTPIFFTAQYLDQIDKRLRKNLQKLSQCSRVIYLKNKMIPIDENRRILDPKLQDRLYIKIIEYRRINVGTYTNLVPRKPFYIKALPYFKLYNTKEKIKQVAVIKI